MEKLEVSSLGLLDVFLSFTQNGKGGTEEAAKHFIKLLQVEDVVSEEDLLTYYKEYK